MPWVITGIRCPLGNTLGSNRNQPGEQPEFLITPVNVLGNPLGSNQGGNQGESCLTSFLKTTGFPARSEVVCR